MTKTDPTEVEKLEAQEDRILHIEEWKLVSGEPVKHQLYAQLTKDYEILEDIIIRFLRMDPRAEPIFLDIDGNYFDGDIEGTWYPIKLSLDV